MTPAGVKAEPSELSVPSLPSTPQTLSGPLDTPSLALKSLVPQGSSEKGLAGAGRWLPLSPQPPTPQSTHVMSAKQAPPLSPCTESPCPDLCGAHSGDRNHPRSFNRGLHIETSRPGVRELKGAERDPRCSCTPGAGETGQRRRGVQATSPPPRRWGDC